MTIEWATLANTEATLYAPGDITDDFGNANDQPALSIGEGAALEGPAADWQEFALNLLDEARAVRHIEEGVLDPTFTPINDLLAAVRAPIARYDAIESDDDPGYHARVDAAIDLIGVAKKLVDALDPQGVAA